jgi:hypothetical protein
MEISKTSINVILFRPKRSLGFIYQVMDASLLTDNIQNQLAISWMTSWPGSIRASYASPSTGKQVTSVPSMQEQHRPRVAATPHGISVNESCRMTAGIAPLV